MILTEYHKDREGEGKKKNNPPETSAAICS